MQTVYMYEQCLKKYLWTILKETKNTSKFDQSDDNDNENNEKMIMKILTKDTYLKMLNIIRIYIIRTMIFQW